MYNIRFHELIQREDGPCMSTVLFENVITLMLQDLQVKKSTQFYNYIYSKMTNEVILISEVGFSIFKLDLNSLQARKTK
jgi:hypothetical protein